MARPRPLAAGFVRVAAIALLFGACARPPVSDEMTIDFSKDDGSVVVTAETTFDLQPGNAAARARMEGARAAVLAGSDPWSARFARVRPERESVTFERTRGALERVTRSVRVGADDLQLVLGDTSVTVSVLRGEGWRELAFYAGTSNRASREQARRFDAEMGGWSRAVADYFRSIDHLYAYLEVQPQRARPVFSALLNEKDPAAEPLLTEDEQPLVDAVFETMAVIAARIDDQQDRATSFAEDADALFNPFPARLKISVPGEVISVQGFPDESGRELLIDRIDLFAAIASLEGRWVDPDPLAASLRQEVPSSENFAAIRRRSTAMVNPSEIEQAIRENLARPRTFVVRWRD